MWVGSSECASVRLSTIWSVPKVHKKKRKCAWNSCGGAPHLVALIGCPHESAHSSFWLLKALYCICMYILPGAFEDKMLCSNCIYYTCNHSCKSLWRACKHARTNPEASMQTNCVHLVVHFHSFLDKLANKADISICGCLAQLLLFAHCSDLLV